LKEEEKEKAVSRESLVDSREAGAKSSKEGKELKEEEKEKAGSPSYAEAPAGEELKEK